MKHNLVILIFQNGKKLKNSRYFFFVPIYLEAVIISAFTCSSTIESVCAWLVLGGRLACRVRRVSTHWARSNSELR